MARKMVLSVLFEVMPFEGQSTVSSQVNIGHP